jgi:hypothetical protein
MRRKKYELLPQEWQDKCDYKLKGVDFYGDKTLYVVVSNQHVRSKRFEDAFIQGDWSEWGMTRIRNLYNSGSNEKTLKDFDEFMSANAECGHRAYKIA